MVTSVEDHFAYSIATAHETLLLRVGGGGGGIDVVLLLHEITVDNYWRSLNGISMMKDLNERTSISLSYYIHSNQHAYFIYVLYIYIYIFTKDFSIYKVFTFICNIL